MLGYIGQAYRVVYAAKNYATGITGITARVFRPNGTVAGPFSLIAIPSAQYNGCYFFDYLSAAPNDTDGQYTVVISSPNEGNYRTIEKFTLQSAVNALGPQLTQIQNDLAALTNLVLNVLGTGFSVSTDSLAALSDKVDLTALQTTSLNILAGVGNIPINPVLATDPRIARLDIEISSRAAEMTLTDIKGVGWLNTTDTLKAIRAAIGAPPTGMALESSVQTAITSIGIRATQASVNAALAAIANIPTNPVLVTDARIARLDVAVSTRATDADIQLIKGTGFDTALHSLEVIKATITAGGADLTPVLNELAVIKGSMFSNPADNLHAINTIAQIERDAIKADTEALLGQGEGT